MQSIYRRLRLFLPLVLLGLVPPNAAQADQWDPPAVEKPFDGMATGTVLWVHNSTWWFMLDVEKLEPTDGSDSSTWQSWIDREEGIKVGLKWVSPDSPDPEQHAWLKGLKPGQKVKIKLEPNPPKPKASARLAELPKGEGDGRDGGGEAEPQGLETAMKGKVKRGFAERVPEEQRGAQIDESSIQHTVTVGPEGDHQTITEAWPTVKKHLEAGEPTRLKLAAGTYRETLGHVKANDQLRDTLLVIEGAGRDQTVMSGSDVVPASRWEEVGDGVYATDWEHDWGNYASPWETPKPIGHRSEMVFVDGECMLPVMIEVYDYQITGQLMDHGNRKQQWKYTGFLDPAKNPNVLAPGSFGVAEKDENGNKLYLRLPEGKAIGYVTVEVSARRQIVNFDGGGDFDGAFERGKNNLVLRGITFQHYASRTKSWGAQDTLALGKNVQNVLIENCAFNWNSSVGLRGDYRQVTLRDVVANYNGFGGFGGSMGELIMEDCVTNYNNWRGYMGGLPGWNWGGVKFGGHEGGNQTIRRHETIGNLTHGFWYDIHPHNIEIEDLVSLANFQAGLDLELNQGPYEITRMLAAGNRKMQAVVGITGEALIEDSILYGSDTRYENLKKDKVPAGVVTHQWYMRSDAHALERPIVPDHFILRDSVLATPSETAGIFIEHNGYDRSSKYYKMIDEAYRGENNIIYADAGDPQFTYVAANWQPATVGLDGWQEHTREKNVQVTDPGFIDARNYNFQLTPDSPLQSRASELPTLKIDPEKIEEAKRFKHWVERGIELNGSGLAEELADAGIPVPPAIEKK